MRCEYALHYDSIGYPLYHLQLKAPLSKFEDLEYATWNAIVDNDKVKNRT
jgi:hypothetical protein